MALSLLPRDQEPPLYSSRATQACVTCRKQKRKCDKILPSCSRCASLQRPCDYSDAASPPTGPSAEAFASLQMKLAEIEARLNSTRAIPPQNQSTPGSSTYVGGSESSPESAGLVTAGSKGDLWVDGQTAACRRTKFPATMFLDSDIHKSAGISIPNPNIDIPMEVLEILASSNVVEETATSYFNTTHRWFPFISKKRMNLGISLSDGGPDLALLFLAMKLITTPPPREMRSAADSHLYASCKRFLAQLESAGTLSILYLQAMILVTLYEFGHSIYPAAWMTSGSCVRYAAMLGLPSYQESCSILGLCTTWTEAEERRRVWWATKILDRAISLGSKKRFAGGPDQPSDAEMLPVDDEAWDSGNMAISLQWSTTTPLDALTASPFARLAQASMLIFRAMEHCKGAARRHARRGADNSGNGQGGEGLDKDAFSIKEVTEIIRDLHTLSHAIETDISNAGGVGSDAFFTLCPSRCLVWSTIIMVLDLYSCPESMRPGAGMGTEDGRRPDELAMQVEAIKGLTTTSERIQAFAVEFLGVSDSPATSPDVSMAGGADGGGPGGVDRSSPLCFDAIYCALATFHWYWKESGQPEMRQGLEQTRAVLIRMAPRWRLAGEYLDMERHHDVMGIAAERADGS